MKKKAFIIMLAVLLAGVIAAGCGQQTSDDGADLTEIRLCEVVHSVFYAPQYVAISQGFFAEEGLDIKLSTAQGADKVMTALLSGAADIGLAGAEATIYVYNQGQEDYVLNFAQLTQRDGSFLLGRQPEADFRWENLKGKTIIGGRPGGMPEMVLEYILKQHGLTPARDVDVITNLQFTATAGAFKGGTGDYVALFEPTATLLEQSKAGHVVASIGESSGEIPYTVYMARKSLIEENPELLQKFTNAIFKAQRWVDYQPAEEIARAVAPFFPDSDMEWLVKVIERYKAQNTWDVDPLMEDESFNYLQEIIKTAGELEKTVEPSILIDREFAKNAILTQP